MKKSTIVIQKWFHIHDEIHDGNLNRKIKEVMDVFTNNEYICHDMSKINFSNFQATNYINGNNLPYIHSKKQINISIGSQSWGKSPSEDCNNEKNFSNELDQSYCHAKISVNYHIKPYFKKKQKLSSGYKTYFASEYLPHPEFHINIQKGMKLNNNSINLIFYLENQDKKEYEFEFNTKNKSLSLQKEIGKNKLILNLDSHIFNKINKKSEFKEMILFYEVENQSKFLLIPFFMIFTWFLSIIELMSTTLLGFPFIMLVTVLIIYLNLIRENYEIPYNKLIISLFFLTFTNFLVKIIIIFS